MPSYARSEWQNEPGKAALRLGNHAGGGQQVQLLGVAVKDGVQVAPALAQQFAAEGDGIRPHGQGGAAGILHAVPGEAVHCLGQRDDLGCWHGDGSEKVRAVALHKNGRCQLWIALQFTHSARTQSNYQTTRLNLMSVARVMGLSLS